MNPKNPIPKPQYRRLRGYAFDPSLSTSFTTAGMNERTYRVRWEEMGDAAGASSKEGKGLWPGPVGEYIEVVDVDPASGCFYEPVDLNERHILAEDGLPASPGNPMFHQQMVYAVVMTTIENFEQALGRSVMWRDLEWKGEVDLLAARDGVSTTTKAQKDVAWEKYAFVRRIRVYPHAMRESNAYYSPAKRALLFGYFPGGATADHPRGMVYTCLSHDIVAHETAHAILDGVHPRWMEVTQPDGFALHEAFADLVALLQHFTFEDVLRHEIARGRGSLDGGSLLAQVAQEFGKATGGHGALRDALGTTEGGRWQRSKPDPKRYDQVQEPHARGEILVAAVFDGFAAVYESRVADLKRIASGGTGVLAEGALHPDLVARMAKEAAKSAHIVLRMIVRALDYCPPVDVDFGNFLRALVTADKNVVGDDGRVYRLAMIDAFRARGIYPRTVRTLSEDALVWERAEMAGLDQFNKALTKFCQAVVMGRTKDRRKQWLAMSRAQRTLHGDVDLKKGTGNGLAGLFHRERESDLGKRLQELTGLDFSITKDEKVDFWVGAMRHIQRPGHDGTVRSAAAFALLQSKEVSGGKVWGGCTILVDLDAKEGGVRYVVRKGLYQQEGKRFKRAEEWLKAQQEKSAGLYGFDNGDEPFAMMHAGCDHD